MISRFYIHRKTLLCFMTAMLPLWSLVISVKAQTNLSVQINAIRVEPGSIWLKLVLSDDLWFVTEHSTDLLQWETFPALAPEGSVSDSSNLNGATLGLAGPLELRCSSPPQGSAHFFRIRVIGPMLPNNPSLLQFTRWVSELSGETEAIIGTNHFQIKTRYARSQESLKAAEYLYAQLSGLGLEVESQPVPSIAASNLLVRLPGVTKPEEVLIVSAHYDSISESPYVLAPGANDNASGTAALLSVASILKHFRCERTIELCFFNGEELDRLGSKEYAARCSMAGRQIVGVLNMDVIMWANSESPFNIRLWVNAGSEILAQSTKKILEKYAPLRAEIVLSEIKAGDEASFWEIGVEGLLIYATAPGFGTIKHTIDDDLRQAGMNPECGLAVARAVAVAALTQGGCLFAQ